MFNYLLTADVDFVLMPCHVCSMFSSGWTNGDPRVGGDQQSGLLSVCLLQNQPGSGGPSQVKK